MRFRRYNVSENYAASASMGEKEGRPSIDEKISSHKDGSKQQI
jgi:hypothetical protein